MTNRLFEVSQLTEFRNCFIVSISANGKQDELKVDKNQFESFLQNFGILEVPVQLNDQRHGIMNLELHFAGMTLEEYYNFKDIRKDIYDYILLNNSRNGANKIFI